MCAQEASVMQIYSVNTLSTSMYSICRQSLCARRQSLENAAKDRSSAMADKAVSTTGLCQTRSGTDEKHSSAVDLVVGLSHQDASLSMAEPSREAFIDDTVCKSSYVEDWKK